VYKDVFSSSDITRLIDFYNLLPISDVKFSPNGKIFRNIKNSEYNFEDQDVFKILNPALTKILGPHQFTGGHWLDAHSPYTLHIDNISDFQKRNIPVFQSPLHKNVGVLIPLVEHQHFNTVFFDHYFEILEPGYIQKTANNSMSLLDQSIMDLLDHHSAENLVDIQRFRLDRVVNWKIGSVLVWPRNQLHCSSNFEKYGLTKQAVVLWL
jgi:hypothetical protein